MPRAVLVGGTWRVTTNVYRCFGRDGVNENIWNYIVIMVAQPCQYIKKHWIAYSTWMNCMLCEWYLNITYIHTYLYTHIYVNGIETREILVYVNFNPTSKAISFWDIYLLSHVLWGFSILARWGVKYSQPCVNPVHPAIFLWLSLTSWRFPLTF